MNNNKKMQQVLKTPVALLLFSIRATNQKNTHKYPAHY